MVSPSFYVQELVVKALRRRGVWAIIQPKAVDPERALSMSRCGLFVRLQITSQLCSGFLSALSTLIGPSAGIWLRCVPRWPIWNHYRSMLNVRWAAQNHHYKRSGIVRKDELSVNLERWDAVRLPCVPRGTQRD